MKRVSNLESLMFWEANNMWKVADSVCVKIAPLQAVALIPQANVHHRRDV
jgi:hypothetical protein